MVEIKLTKRYPNSRTEDITDAYMRGWNDALDAVQNGKFHIADTLQMETKTETENSNLTFENRTMLDCYNCKRYKSDDACVECRYEPIADTPQTDLVKDSSSLVKGLVNKGLVKYTPPTDGVEWEDYIPFDVKEPLNHVGIIRGETDCPWK